MRNFILFVLFGAFTLSASISSATCKLDLVYKTKTETTRFSNKQVETRNNRVVAILAKSCKVTTGTLTFLKAQEKAWVKLSEWVNNFDNPVRNYCNTLHDDSFRTCHNSLAPLSELINNKARLAQDLSWDAEEAERAEAEKKAEAAKEAAHKAFLLEAEAELKEIQKASKGISEISKMLKEGI